MTRAPGLSSRTHAAGTPYPVPMSSTVPGSPMSPSSSANIGSKRILNCAKTRGYGSMSRYRCLTRAATCANPVPGTLLPAPPDAATRRSSGGTIITVPAKEYPMPKRSVRPAFLNSAWSARLSTPNPIMVDIAERNTVSRISPRDGCDSSR